MGFGYGGEDCGDAGFFVGAHLAGFGFEDGARFDFGEVVGYVGSELEARGEQKRQDGECQS